MLTALVVFGAWVLVSRVTHDDGTADATTPTVRPTTSPAPSATRTSSPTHSRAPASSRPAPTPTKPSADQQHAAAKAALSKIIDAQPGGAVSVAALNVKTGRSLTMGADSGMWTASAYKLLLLEVLLYQHQKSGTYLSDAEDSDATAAMEHSDNVAGYQLWIDVGRNAGQAPVMKAFGMKHSKTGVTDPTFTTLSASDALILLKNLVDSDSPLSTSARKYVLGLMRNVEPDQRWGVGAAADKGTTFYNKNGWLSIDNANGPGERDDGLWAVTSLGVVTVNGQQVLMAVLTRHQPDFDKGRALVEQLAKSLAQAVAPSS